MTKHKKEVKEEALRLRTEEKMSLSEISKTLKISKGTASVWLRDFPLEEKDLKERRLKWLGSEENLKLLSRMREKSKLVCTGLERKPFEELVEFKAVRRKILNERGRKCEICGWQEVSPFSKTIPVQVHHINKNRKDNRRENLMVLCPNCHSLTEGFMNYKTKNED